MRSSRTGSWSPGVNEVETFILASLNHSEILIEILIELCVRTQAAHLLVLVAKKQGTQGNDLVTATEENGNEAAGGDRCPAQPANRRRWSSLKHIRRLPICSRRTQFSSIKINTLKGSCGDHNLILQSSFVIFYTYG